jgi:hypothetical protein
MALAREIEYVAWSDRVSEPVPSCLFTGSATLQDVIAARLIVAIAPRLPDVLFHVAGLVCGGIATSTPANVRLHPRPAAELFTRARLGLSPITETLGGRERVVSFSRAGLPVIASPAASRGFEPALTDCWLVVTPEPGALRDAIVESLDWDWSAPVAEARRLVSATAS